MKMNESLNTENNGAREQQNPSKVCRSCHAVLTNGENFCPHCGGVAEELQPTTPVCKKCGLELTETTKFCPYCGTETHPKKSKFKRFKKKDLLIIGGIFAVIALLTALLIVILSNREIPVKDLSLSCYQLELDLDESKSITYTISPNNATEKAVIWSTSNQYVASVTSYGTIKGVGEGTCTITAKVGNQTKQIYVIVKEKLDFETIFDRYCDEEWASVGKDNSYLSIDTNPNDYDDFYIYAADSAIVKINAALNLPDSLYEEMGKTSASMGKQTETFSDIGVIVRWTYHPDKGLEVTYKRIQN